MTKPYHFSKFGIWLKHALAENQMKQRDLAEELKVAEATISRWIHGDREPKAKQKEQILKLFGYHLEIVPNQTTNETWRNRGESP